MSPEFVGMLKDGLLELPGHPVWGLPEMGPVPQTQEDLGFARADLEEGFRKGIYELVSDEEKARALEDGYLISSAFTLWQGEGDERKNGFGVNFSKQSKFWDHKPLRMESAAGFATELKKGERLLSFDLSAGYRHIHLHLDRYSLFLFSYEGRTYRCLALPFGWNGSAFHFKRLMRPFVGYMRNVWGYRVLLYLDDYLVAPGARSVATAVDCRRAVARIQCLMDMLGLARHPRKGVWDSGAIRLDQLGLTFDTMTMEFTVTARKQSRLRRLAGKLLRQSTLESRFVSASALKTFCVVAISLHLALARFYTRALYDSLKYPRREFQDKGARARLSNAAIKKLRYWRRLDPEEPALCVHSDAADLGWGGTVGTVIAAGDPGRATSGIWTAEDSRRSINHRELMALRLTLEGVREDEGTSARGVGGRRRIMC